MENIPHTAQEIKDNFFKNLELLPKADLESKEYKEVIEKLQLELIEERFNKLKK